MATLPFDLGNVQRLRDQHPAWRLLTASTAPLIISFLHQAFLRANTRTASQPDLASLLDDHLHAARSQGFALPRSADSYVDDWASDTSGWLRKFYPTDSDEAHFDLTPAAERAINWVARLLERRFVGTESRLLTVFQLLREMVEGSEQDPDRRLADLLRRRAEVDSEIERLQKGEVAVMDPAALKDRFQQMASTARELLADFRELEQSFHQLDREVRQRIAGWSGGRGELLDNVLGQRDSISDSDQGASFRGFWDFLMSTERQEEFTSKLQRVLRLNAIQELAPDPRLGRVHYDWLAAGETTQRTVARLSEQLRRYLDDKVWLDNRRIVDLIRSINQHALAVAQTPPTALDVALDDCAPGIELPFERPLFSPPFQARITKKVLEAGDGEVPTEALFDQVSVDRPRLRANITALLQAREQVSLLEVIAAHPLQHGLAELVVYLAIASERDRSVINEETTQSIQWIDDRGRRKRARVPLVVFVR